MSQQSDDGLPELTESVERELLVWERAIREPQSCDPSSQRQNLRLAIRRFAKECADRAKLEQAERSIEMWHAPFTDGTLKENLYRERDRLRTEAEKTE